MTRILHILNFRDHFVRSMVIMANFSKKGFSYYPCALRIFRSSGQRLGELTEKNITAKIRPTSFFSVLPFAFEHIELSNDIYAMEDLCLDYSSLAIGVLICFWYYVFYLFSNSTFNLVGMVVFVEAVLFVSIFSYLYVFNSFGYVDHSAIMYLFNAAAIDSVIGVVILVKAIEEKYDLRYRTLGVLSSGWYSDLLVNIFFEPEAALVTNPRNEDHQLTFRLDTETLFLSHKRRNIAQGPLLFYLQNLYIGYRDSLITIWTQIIEQIRVMAIGITQKSLWINFKKVLYVVSHGLSYSNNVNSIGNNIEPVSLANYYIDSAVVDGRIGVRTRGQQISVNWTNSTHMNRYIYSGFAKNPDYIREFSWINATVYSLVEVGPKMWAAHVDEINAEILDSNLTEVSRKKNIKNEKKVNLEDIKKAAAYLHSKFYPDYEERSARKFFKQDEEDWPYPDGLSNQFLRDIRNRNYIGFEYQKHIDSMQKSQIKVYVPKPEPHENAAERRFKKHLTRLPKKLRWKILRKLEKKKRIEKSIKRWNLFWEWLHLKTELALRKNDHQVDATWEGETPGYLNMIWLGKQDELLYGPSYKTSLDYSDLDDPDFYLQNTEVWDEDYFVPEDYGIYPFLGSDPYQDALVSRPDPRDTSIFEPDIEEIDHLLKISTERNKNKNLIRHNLQWHEHSSHFGPYLLHGPVREYQNFNFKLNSKRQRVILNTELRKVPEINNNLVNTRRPYDISLYGGLTTFGNFTREYRKKAYFDKSVEEYPFWANQIQTVLPWYEGPDFEEEPLDLGLVPQYQNKMSIAEKNHLSFKKKRIKRSHPRIALKKFSIRKKMKIDKDFSIEIPQNIIEKNESILIRGNNLSKIPTHNNSSKFKYGIDSNYINAGSSVPRSDEYIGPRYKTFVKKQYNPFRYNYKYFEKKKQIQTVADLRKFTSISKDFKKEHITTTKTPIVVGKRGKKKLKKPYVSRAFSKKLLSWRKRQTSLQDIGFFGSKTTNYDPRDNVKKRFNNRSSNINFSNASMVADWVGGRKNNFKQISNHTSGYLSRGYFGNTLFTNYNNNIMNLNYMGLSVNNKESYSGKQELNNFSKTSLFQNGSYVNSRDTTGLDIDNIWRYQDIHMNQNSFRPLGFENPYIDLVTNNLNHENANTTLYKKIYYPQRHWYLDRTMFYSPNLTRNKKQKNYLNLLRTWGIPHLNSDQPLTKEYLNTDLSLRSKILALGTIPQSLEYSSLNESRLFYDIVKRGQVVLGKKSIYRLDSPDIVKVSNLVGTEHFDGKLLDLVVPNNDKYLDETGDGIYSLEDSIYDDEEDNIKSKLTLDTGRLEGSTMAHVPESFNYNSTGTKTSKQLISNNIGLVNTQFDWKIEPSELTKYGLSSGKIKKRKDHKPSYLPDGLFPTLLGDRSSELGIKYKHKDNLLRAHEGELFYRESTMHDILCVPEFVENTELDEAAAYLRVTDEYSRSRTNMDLYMGEDECGDDDFEEHLLDGGDIQDTPDEDEDIMDDFHLSHLTEHKPFEVIGDDVDDVFDDVDTDTSEYLHKDYAFVVGLQNEGVPIKKIKGPFWKYKYMPLGGGNLPSQKIDDITEGEESSFIFKSGGEWVMTESDIDEDIDNEIDLEDTKIVDPEFPFKSRYSIREQLQGLEDVIWENNEDIVYAQEEAVDSEYSDVGRIQKTLGDFSETRYTGKPDISQKNFNSPVYQPYHLEARKRFWVEPDSDDIFIDNIYDKLRSDLLANKGRMSPTKAIIDLYAVINSLSPIVINKTKFTNVPAYRQDSGGFDGVHEIANTLVSYDGKRRLLENKLKEISVFTEGTVSDWEDYDDDEPEDKYPDNTFNILLTLISRLKYDGLWSPKDTYMFSAVLDSNNLKSPYSNIDLLNGLDLQGRLTGEAGLNIHTELDEILSTPFKHSRTGFYDASPGIVVREIGDMVEDDILPDDSLLFERLPADTFETPKDRLESIFVANTLNGSFIRDKYKEKQQQFTGNFQIGNITDYRYFNRDLPALNKNPDLNSSEHPIINTFKIPFLSRFTQKRQLYSDLYEEKGYDPLDSSVLDLLYPLKLNDSQELMTLYSIPNLVQNSEEEDLYAFHPEGEKLTVEYSPLLLTETEYHRLLDLQQEVDGELEGIDDENINWLNAFTPGISNNKTFGDTDSTSQMFGLSSNQEAVSNYSNLYNNYSFKKDRDYVNDLVLSNEWSNGTRMVMFPRSVFYSTKNFYGWKNNTYYGVGAGEKKKKLVHGLKPNSFWHMQDIDETKVTMFFGEPDAYRQDYRPFSIRDSVSKRDQQKVYSTDQSISLKNNGLEDSIPVLHNKLGTVTDLVNSAQQSGGVLNFKNHSIFSQNITNLVIPNNVTYDENSLVDKVVLPLLEMEGGQFKQEVFYSLWNSISFGKNYSTRVTEDGVVFKPRDRKKIAKRLRWIVREHASALKEEAAYGEADFIFKKAPRMNSTKLPYRRDRTWNDQKAKSFPNVYKWSYNQSRLKKSLPRKRKKAKNIITPKPRGQLLEYLFAFRQHFPTNNQEVYYSNSFDTFSSEIKTSRLADLRKLRSFGSMSTVLQKPAIQAFIREKIVVDTINRENIKMWKRSLHKNGDFFSLNPLDYVPPMDYTYKKLSSTRNPDRAHEVQLDNTIANIQQGSLLNLLETSQNTWEELPADYIVKSQRNQIDTFEKLYVIPEYDSKYDSNDEYIGYNTQVDYEAYYGNLFRWEGDLGSRLCEKDWSTLKNNAIVCKRSKGWWEVYVNWATIVNLIESLKSLVRPDFNMHIRLADRNFKRKNLNSFGKLKEMIVFALNVEDFFILLNYSIINWISLIIKHTIESTLWCSFWSLRGFSDTLAKFNHLLTHISTSWFFTLTRIELTLWRIITGFTKTPRVDYWGILLKNRKVWDFNTAHRVSFINYFTYIETIKEYVNKKIYKLY